MSTTVRSAAEVREYARSDDDLTLNLSFELVSRPEDEIESLLDEIGATEGADHIRGLVLSSNGLSGGAVPRLLGRAKWLAGLRRLFVCENQLDTESAEALAECRFESLETLDLGANYLGDDAAAALAQASWFPSLRTLVLETNFVGAPGVEAFVDRDEPLALEVLSLGPSMQKIGDEGVRALAESGLLPRLRQLVLSNNGITNQGLAVILDNLDLRFLDLSNDEDVWYADMQSWARNTIDDEGARAIARHPKARSFRELFLAGNPIGDDARRELLQSLAPACDCDLD